MKKFLLLNQDEEPMFEVQWREFNCAILELGFGCFVVDIVPHADGHAHAVALYRDIVEAAQAVQELCDFAFSVTRENQAFAMPQATEPISTLEIVDLLT